MRPLAAAVLLLAACSSSPATAPTPVKPGPTAAPPPAPAAERPEPGKAPAVKLDASLAEPTAYKVKLDIDPSAETFTGRVTIDVAVKKPTDFIWLNAKDIEVTETAVRSRDGAWTVKVDDDFIAVGVPGGFTPGDHQVTLGYKAKVGASRSMTGVFSQKEKGRDYLYTQFEATGARRAFPCFDQPEFKTPWTLEIEAPAGQVVFANTPGTGEPNHKTFATSKPLPSYLVAFAVGPFEIVDIGTGGRNNTPMRIIVPQGRKAHTAHAAKHMKTILKTLEDYFDLAYPYAKLDSIAVPEFFGAMENPGLVTYAAGILLVEPGKETERFRKGHLNVVAHELAHQWFGDLVTLRWWDDLWLNESFASWMADKVVNTLRPDWEGAVRRAQTRDGSMAIDARDTTRPVRQEVNTREDMVGIFNAGITYGKGSVVIAMFESWIGEDKFRSGVREYMRTHAWKTTTAADFFASLAKVSDAALPKAFATFIDQNGVPLVTARLECKANKATLELEQSRLIPTGSKASPDSRTWQIPACAKYGVRGKEHRVCKLLKAKKATLELDAAKRCPDWVVANAESAGYYRVRYQGDLLKRILKASKALSTADRIGVIGDVEALVSSGQVKVGDALGLIPRLIRDRNPEIVASAAGIASSIADHVPDKRLENYRRFITRTFGRDARKLGWQDGPKDSKTTRELRDTVVPLVAIAGRDTRLLKQALALAKRWLDDPKVIERDRLGSLLRAAALVGDTQLYKKLVHEAKTTDDRRLKGTIMQAVGNFTDKTLVNVTLDSLLDKDLPMRATFGLLQTMMGNRETRDQAYAFVDKHLDELASRLPTMARSYMVFGPVAFCDEGRKKEVDDVAKRLGDVPGLERAVQGAKAAIDECVAQRARQRPEIEAFLRRY